MFEVYTIEARQTIFAARDEADKLGRDQGHIQGPGSRPLKMAASVDVPLAESTKRALLFARDEAPEMGSESIVPRHLLLGILREGDKVAAEMLKHRGVEPENVRSTIKSNGDWSAGAAG